MPFEANCVAMRSRAVIEWYARSDAEQNKFLVSKKIGEVDKRYDI